MEQTLYFQPNNDTIASITLDLRNNEISYTGETNEYHISTYSEIYEDYEERLLIAMKDDTENIYDKLQDQTINDLLEQQINKVFDYPKDELDVADLCDPIIETYPESFRLSDAVHYMEFTAGGQCYDDLSALIQNSNNLSDEQKLALQQVLFDWHYYHLTRPSDHAKTILLKNFETAQKLNYNEDSADQLFEDVLNKNYQENKTEGD